MKQEKRELKREILKRWRVKASAVPVVIRALGVVTIKPKEWLQQISVHASGLRDKDTTLTPCRWRT